MTTERQFDARCTAAAPAAVRLRWLRIAAIATAAVSLASCRAMPTSALLTAEVASHESTAADDVGHEPIDGQATIHRTGLETPCPPLPRTETPFVNDGPCPSGACGASGIPAACAVCLPPPLPPIVGPYLVCDGGDHERPAKPIGADRIGHLTAGDTVARYRAADEMPDSADVRLVTSNCACVYAPRFGAVREVTRPIEDSRPEGLRDYILDTGVELEERREPLCNRTQTVSLEAARKALPGIAVQDRLGPIAVDQGDMPHEDDGVEGPAARVLDQRLELERLRQLPHERVGFDVPIAWTCIKAANVLLGDQAAEAVAVDRGTAVLRFEEPGRAELTLCKQAGTDTARSGEEIDFTIFMLNSGDRPLTGIVLSDALPTRLTLVPDSAAASVPAVFATETADDGAVVLTWRLEGTLRPGESGFVRFRTLVQ